MNPDFSRIITLLRKERKISQKKAAADLGISQALLSHYEKGIRECGLDFLVKLSGYYSVSCDYLLGLSPEPQGRVSAVPDETDEAGRERNPEAALAAFNKKILINSISMLYALTVKSGSNELGRCVTRSLSLCVYKLFRMIFSANPQNDTRMFSVSEALYPTHSDAAMKLNEGDTLVAAQDAPNKNALLLGNADFAGEYSKYSSSMLNLIKNSEKAIKEISSDSSK